MHNALRGLTSEEQSLRAGALEFVDNLLDWDTKQYLLPLLDDATGEQAVVDVTRNDTSGALEFSSVVAGELSQAACLPTDGRLLVDVLTGRVYGRDCEFRSAAALEPPYSTLVQGVGVAGLQRERADVVEERHVVQRLRRRERVAVSRPGGLDGVRPDQLRDDRHHLQPEPDRPRVHATHMRGRA